MAIGNAWVGTILRVDLSAGTVAKEPLNMQDAHDYVGTKYYCNEVDPQIDPFSPRTS